ncbi:hypothetical protein Ccrd_024489 [Cynara cardunculus var. scolymus]|uniref:Uncharacterized protein n=1 Tax=Cynara cardunculus var. scolymus TaxID=59895 RepID=A0A118JS33_CYNCS|nr:hypothetical protein Ccrd_024489 [Cynara cardunculus var. scolymus]
MLTLSKMLRHSHPSNLLLQRKLIVSIQLSVEYA